MVNKTLAKVVGKNASEIIGKTISETYPAETAEKFLANIDKVFNSGESLFIDERMFAQGRELDISTSLNPVFNKSEKVIAVTGIVRDITERKELEKQLKETERLAAIGTTAGMVGHDIRNPLQAILGDLFLIEQEINANKQCENKDIEEYLQNVNDNIAYINKIVSDLQDYTRIIKPTLTKVQLVDVVFKVIEGFKVPNNIQIGVDINEDVFFKTDETYLMRILSNLIGNAIQAMSQGGTLTIRAHKEENSMVIKIIDTGVGIADKDKPQLFQPLFTTKAKGQGLGLAVVKRFIEALNGTITVESQVGKGTVFTIQLPDQTAVKD
jgi:PAS domain S-box-containing protein